LPFGDGAREQRSRYLLVGRADGKGIGDEKFENPPRVPDGVIRGLLWRATGSA
jgi:hypothetical protein